MYLSPAAVPDEPTVSSEHHGIPGAQVSNEMSALVADHTPLLMRLVLISVSTIAIFYSLGERLLKWDESIYAEVAREMLNRHNWLTPYWNFQPWFEKPPLLMWLTAPMYRLFGASEFSARMVGALCGVATVWLTFELGRRLLDDWSGFAAAAILLTNGYFTYISRFNGIDMSTTFCFTVVAYAYLRVRQGDPRWWYIAGAFTGIAIMVKGAAGLCAPLALAFALLLDRRFSDLRSREVRNSVVLGCAIAMPWHLMMLILHGRDFLNEYLGYHVLARMRGIEMHAEPAYYYLSEYWNVFVPFALAALVGLWLHVKGQKDSSIVVSFFLLITATFTLIGTKMSTYVVPAFPFISLLAAMGIRSLMKPVKYATVRAIIIVPLYLFNTACPRAGRGFVEWNYSPTFSYDGSITLNDDPLIRLAIQARAADHDPTPGPLIICLDAIKLWKEQPLFYADRPIILSYLNVPPDWSISSGGLQTIPYGHNRYQARYQASVPLERAVTSRPVPIIILSNLYPELTHSRKYNFTTIAESGPLILGQISRR